MTSLAILAILSPMILIVLVAVAGVLTVWFALFIVRALFWLAVGGLIGLTLWAGEARAQQSYEIHGTAQMLKTASMMMKDQYPDTPANMWEYHFRNYGGHILWCAHARGGNGGFCTKITSIMIAETDRVAKDYCKTAAPDDDTPPHAVYGELWDLGYKCAGGRVSRLPITMALDSEGYVRSQWKLLP